MFSAQQKSLFYALFTAAIASQLFIGCSGPKEALNGSTDGTGGGTSSGSASTFSDQAGDLTNSLSNSTVTGTGTGTGTATTVSTTAQAKCYTGLAYNPGFSGTNTFGNIFGTSTGTGTGTATGTTSTTTAGTSASASGTQSQCLANGLTSQAASSLAVNTLNYTELCTQVAFIKLNLNEAAAQYSGVDPVNDALVTFAACLVRLNGLQQNSAQWTQQSLDGFTASTWNITDLARRIDRAP